MSDWKRLTDEIGVDLDDYSKMRVYGSTIEGVLKQEASERGGIWRTVCTCKDEAEALAALDRIAPREKAMDGVEPSDADKEVVRRATAKMLRREVPLCNCKCWHEPHYHPDPYTVNGIPIVLPTPEAKQAREDLGVEFGTALNPEADEKDRPNLSIVQSIPVADVTDVSTDPDWIKALPFTIAYWTGAYGRRKTDSADEQPTRMVVVGFLDEQARDAEYDNIKAAMDNAQ